jgi:hypothetical protein
MSGCVLTFTPMNVMNDEWDSSIHRFIGGVGRQLRGHLSGPFIAITAFIVFIAKAFTDLHLKKRRGAQTGHLDTTKSAGQRGRFPKGSYGPENGTFRNISCTFPYIRRARSDVTPMAGGQR